MSITIAAWNVNSVKTRLQHLLGFLQESQPSIVLLQETKTVSETFPRMEIEELGYNLALYGQKSYNGVAILSKFPLEDISCGLPGDETDEQARYIEAVVSIPGGALRVASVYVPNGQSVDSDKFVYKLRFFDRLYKHLKSRLSLGEMFAIGGDYNVAPEPIDIYDPVRLDGTICFHPREREKWRAITHLGYYDAFRAKHPTEQQFSWWDYRENSFERNHGFRIDHFLLSPQAMDSLEKCEIVTSPRKLEKPSDHTPIICSLSTPKI